MTTPSLDPQALEFIRATAKPPYLFDLGPAEGRALVDRTQTTDVPRPDCDVAIRRLAVTAGGPRREVTLHVIRPRGARGPMPALLYLHGGGWVFGSAVSHDRLVRELAVGAGFVAVFVRYNLAPEARHPSALEECYAALEWIASHGVEVDIDPSRIVIAGDSAGGNLAAVVAMLAKERRGPALRGQLLFYPVTDAGLDTPSYEQFATGYWLRRDAMRWFFDQYAPDPAVRSQSSVSPLRASDAELRGLPEALILTAEADVLRDEGEAYAARLREAGVPVAAMRFLGTIHDFVMLDALASSNAGRAATAVAIDWLRRRAHERG
jgi:acetyl esterase